MPAASASFRCDIARLSRKYLSFSPINGRDDEMQPFSKGVFACHPQACLSLPFRAYVQEDALGI
jgi:hypothetical protein